MNKRSRKSNVFWIFFMSISLVISSFGFAYGQGQILKHDQQPYDQYSKDMLLISGEGIKKSKKFTKKELENMEAGKINEVYTMQTLVEPHNGQYAGISLNYLLEKVIGLKEDAKSVKIVCADGISMTFSLGEIQKQDYMNGVDDSKLPVILAYGKDGYPLVPRQTDQGYTEKAGNDGGPIRLMIGQTVKNERNSPKCLRNVTEIVVGTKGENASFQDIGQFYQWAKDGIEALAEKGIIKGTGDGKFGPEKSLTRGEFATIMTKALKLKPNGNYKGTFKDVKKGDWFTPYVELAATQGLIKGYEDHTFRPNEKVSRQEMVVVVIQGMGLENEVKTRTGDKMTFKDKDQIPYWVIGSAEIAEEKGLLDNISVGYFGGKKASNRAEAAVIVYRMLKEIN